MTCHIQHFILFSYPSQNVYWLTCYRWDLLCNHINSVNIGSSHFLCLLNKPTLPSFLMSCRLQFSGNLIIVSMNKKKCILLDFPWVCRKNIWTLPSMFSWLHTCMFIDFYLEINAIWTQICYNNVDPKFCLELVYIILWLQFLQIWRSRLCLFRSADSHL